MRRTLVAPLIATAAGIATLAAVVLPAWADTKSFGLTGFDRLTVGALMQVELKQGPFAITVEAPSGDFSNLRLELKGSTLVVARQDDHGVDRDAPEYRVTVTAPDFRQINVAAASEVEGKGLSLRSVRANVSTASSLKLAGSCTDLDLNVSTAGDFRGDDFKCQTVTANASTGADAKAWVSGKASGNASTGGQITFLGSPADVSKHESLGGLVRSR